MRLIDITTLVRAKNAGPFLVTVDILFTDEAGYRLACASASFSTENLAASLGVATGDVAIFHVPSLPAVKLTMPRQVVSGAPGDVDVFGCQVHAPIVLLPLDAAGSSHMAGRGDRR